MSMFDAYTTTKAVEIKRQFLRLPKKDFLYKFDLVSSSSQGRPGRPIRYSEKAIWALDSQVNAKAIRAETATSLAERLQLARDYQLTTDAEIGRAMSVSRELVRQWRSGRVYPRNTACLAGFLKVPESWLIDGGDENLPADSHVGVRVGDEAMLERAVLRDLTETVLQKMSIGAEVKDIQAFLEQRVRSDAILARLARRAGGRWQYFPTARHGDTLCFAPWLPIHEHGLSKRLWSDDVEALISEKMDSGKSIYAIWQELKAECEANGWDYPQKISLYKRVRTTREREERFGIDLNKVIPNECVAAF